MHNLHLITCDQLEYYASLRDITISAHHRTGRIHWKKAYWRSLSIVQSDPALEEILARSTTIRSEILPGKRETS